MKPVTTRNSKRPASPMRILLIWTLVSGLLFGVAEFGEPLDDIFRIARNKMREHNASGQVVVVGIDDLAQRRLSAPLPHLVPLHPRVVVLARRLPLERPNQRSAVAVAVALDLQPHLAHLQ